MQYKMMTMEKVQLNVKEIHIPISEERQGLNLMKHKKCLEDYKEIRSTVPLETKSTSSWLQPSYKGYDA